MQCPTQRWEEHRKERARQDREFEVAAQAARGMDGDDEDSLRRLCETRLKSEIGWADLPAALRILGCAPAGSSAAEVRTAYKKAGLKFHPDRTRSAALADRIRGEEVWKLLGAKLADFNAKHGT
jgi:hypothetical protein